MVKSITYEEAEQSHPLAKVVLEQLGGDDDAIETASDASRHGANAGFGGFTYHRETCEFARKNLKEIKVVASELASEMGESSAISMIKKFQCLNNEFTEYEIGEVLYTGKHSDDNVET